MSDRALELERASRYVSLGTWRRSGVPVDTPIWFAARDGRLVFFTNGSSGKVKRLRNSDRARVATCDARGDGVGAWQEGRARLVPTGADFDAALDALRARYGWQFRLVALGATLRGSRGDWQVIEFSFAD